MGVARVGLVEMSPDSCELWKGGRGEGIKLILTKGSTV